MPSDQSRVQARTWWWTAAATAALVGWVAALLTTPPSALVAAAVVFSALSLLFSTGVQAARESRRPEPGAVTADWRRLVDHAAVGTVGAIAALGWLQVSLGLILVVGVGLGVTGAWVFSWRPPLVAEPAGEAAEGNRAGAAPAASRVPSPGAPESLSEVGSATPAPEVRSLSTPELVLAWRRSYSQLMRVRTPQQLAALAARRQQLLDELERRDGAGVERWLRSGARAASDPSRFLQRPTGPSAASA